MQYVTNSNVSLSIYKLFYFANLQRFWEISEILAKRFGKIDEQGHQSGVLCFVFLVGDAFVEGLTAFVALGEEVEAHAANMLLGAEGLGIVHLLALNLEFHHAPVREAHFVAFAQMAVDNFGHAHQHARDVSLAESCALRHFLDNLFAVNGLVVDGYGLVFAIGW